VGKIKRKGVIRHVRNSFHVAVCQWSISPLMSGVAAFCGGHWRRLPDNESPKERKMNKKYNKTILENIFL
jgi:hypothetical protein